MASHKKNVERRPDLRGKSIEAWFEQICERLKTQSCSISKAVANEAAKVPGVYGWGDPGDCFLIATARINGLTLATRDARIIKLSEEQPDYLTILAC